MYIKVLTNRIKRFLLIDVFISKTWHGNDYGGFYVADEQLNRDSIVYSFGVGEDISFDRSIKKQYSCQIYLFDPTPRSESWLKTQCDFCDYNYLKVGLAKKSGEKQFYLPKNNDHVSGSLTNRQGLNQDSISCTFLNLREIMQKLQHNYVDLIKMDIEGEEYEVIRDLLNMGVIFGQIIVEFHDRFESVKDNSKYVIMEMRKHGYQCFGVSKSLEEMSFIHVSIL